LKFWNRFSIRARILILILLVIFPLTLMMGSSIYSGVSQYVKKRRELEAIEHIKHHVNILSLLQKHRGLMFIYLEGDKRVEERIQSLEEEIKRRFEECLKKCKYPKRREALRRFFSQFGSLLLSSILKDGLSPREVFDKHTALIGGLLSFVREEVTEEGLLTDSDPYVGTLADVTLIELPQLAEILGKIRGLGSGILAKKNLSEEERRDIVELYRLLSGYKSVLGWTVGNIRLSRELREEFYRALALVDGYLDFVESSFIVRFDSAIDPVDFFNSSSKVIESVYRIYRSFNEYLRSFVEEEGEAYLASFTLETAGLVLFSVLLTGIAFAIYRTISVSLEEILKVADGISSGNFDVRVAISDKSEFGKVGRALNVALKKLKETVTVLRNYKLAVDESNVILKTDLNGVITYANKEFVRLSGYKDSEVIGKHLSFVFKTFSDEKNLQDALKALKEGRLWKGRLVGSGKGGKKCIVDTTIVPISKENKEVFEFVVICHDITELEESRRKLYYLLNYDSVTGLPNRNRLLEDVPKAGYPAICVLDISDFNRLNELLGEECGDEILKQVAEALKKFSKNVIPYRVQSDEFALFYDLEKGLRREEFLAFCREIVNSLERHAFKCKEIDIFLNFRAGFVAGRENKENLLARADVALNEAKKRQLKIWETSAERQESDYFRNMVWIKKVRGALEDHRVVPFYQPIYGNFTGKVEKFEALVRILDEDGQFVSPAIFLPIAKKAGIYPELTREVFKQVLEDFRDMPFEVSLNISFEDLVSDRTLGFILDSVSKFSSPERLTFEILETEEIENYNLLHSFVSQIKAFGCKFAIDDFGTGYSNFEHLMKLRVDFLKIDGSIIKRLPDDRGAQALTEAIVSFSKELGIRTVAEFVSSREIFETVREIGVDYSQGFYFGKPEPIEVIRSKFKKL